MKEYDENMARIDRSIERINELTEQLKRYERIVSGELREANDEHDRVVSEYQS